MGFLNDAIDEDKLVDRAAAILVPALTKALEPLLKAAVTDLVFALDGLTITVSRKPPAKEPGDA